MTDTGPPASAPPTPAPPHPTPRRASPLTWAVSLALAALVGALLFVGGYLAAGSSGAASCAAPTQEFKAFCEAYERIQQQFVDDPDEGALVEGAIQGMFEYGLADPFSGYMAPEDYQRAQEDLSGRFSGIGAEMGVKNVEDPQDLEACTTFSSSCVLVVIAPLEGSPAEAAGLQPGDIVLEVDRQPVDGMSLDDAVQRVRGEAGTEVTITIRRGRDEPFEVTITRAEIEMREVTSELLDGRVGYVALHGFSNAASEQLREAIGELLDQGATALVFDLRNNPGGYIEAARQVASEFIADGVIFRQESSGDEVRNWEATGDGVATDADLPLVVLVNGGSASASEIVAAALQERGRATIVGQPTYGKNTVQVWSELGNGGGVRITVSRWFTPNDNSVAPNGIQPDEVVRVPEGTPPERDLILERAIDILADRNIGTDESAAPAARVGPAGGSALSPAAGPVSYDPRGQLAALA
ncbi:MAG TPA: S41 family peptidase [Candidatus Limnocylindria bacterium]|nr:S41 family peptidase [Candidatus Limnocylindria bacterium]